MFVLSILKGREGAVFIDYLLSYFYTWEMLLSSLGMEGIYELKWLKQGDTCLYAILAICEWYFHTASSS